MYKLFLTIRYLLRKRIAVFAILSVWLCVAMVLIVFSVMDGFLDNIKQHSRGLLSDIVIHNATLQGFPYYEEFAAYLHENLPETVEVTTPVIYNYGIMRVKPSNVTQPVRVVGINLQEYCRVNTFCDGLYYDKFYPGTTSLQEQPVPIAGLNESGKPILPEEYEQAFARYRETHANDESLQELEPTLHSPHGVGLFEQGLEEPGYAYKPLPGIVIGTDVIYLRNADGSYDRVLYKGNEVILTLLPLTARGTIAENPIALAMRHVDDSRTRVYEIDSLCVYVDFDLLQRLLSMGPLEMEDGSFTPARASQMLIRTRDGIPSIQGRERVQAAWYSFLGTLEGRDMRMEDIRLLDRVEIVTWQDMQVQFIAAVEKEKVLVTALFGIISLVAVVLIGVIFYMIVLQKTRDIGIIRSLGATRMGVASVYLMYGAAVGVIGGILGTVSGTIFVHYINEVQDMLAQLNPNLRVWSPDVYTFDRIPNIVKPHAMLGVFIMAVGTSVLGAVVPAIKAASVWPVEAIRYE